MINYNDYYNDKYNYIIIIILIIIISHNYLLTYMIHLSVLLLGQYFNLLWHGCITKHYNYDSHYQYEYEYKYL